jgi:outer membrane lipoprotein LolB
MAPAFINTRYAAVIYLLILAGCAGRPAVSTIEKSSLWEQHSRRLAVLASWELAGRLSVRMEQEGGSASLFWQQDRDRYALRIVAPLGRGTTEISGDQDSTQLRTAEGRVYKDTDVSGLMRDNLGWEVPVASLSWWVRGLPDPGLPQDNLQIDDQGLASSLRQDGWTVEYERHQTSGDYRLPALITLQRRGLKLRLSISRWQLGP